MGKHEDIKLKGAIQADGGKEWARIAELVPGRTNDQCKYTWKNILLYHSLKNLVK
jgi:uncharacterized membrane protein YfhO